jgi:hypothetical protein
MIDRAEFPVQRNRTLNVDLSAVIPLEAIAIIREHRTLEDGWVWADRSAAPPRCTRA